MRRAPQGNIELVPEKQVLDFNPAPRPERVGDKQCKQMTECKHHSDDALILPHCANPPRMKFSGATVHDERKFNEMAAPIEAKHDAPWLKRRKNSSGVEEIIVVDLDRRIERSATPEEIESGVEYRDYDHYMEGKDGR